ncbi:MAG TPA: gamma-glutamyltransferase, partial [bacterium]|nr:gamma-glutamyltransferase [bacterium]
MQPNRATGLFARAVCCVLTGLLAPGALRAQAAREPEPGVAQLRVVAPVTAATAMVVTANPLASQAGFEVLRAGGNAVDAAIAAAFALNVVEPQSSGVGGGGFILVYLARRHQVLAIDGREEAPAAATPTWFLAPDGKPQPFYPDRITGGRPVGVPGMVRALAKASSLGGRLPWSRLLTPGLKLAQQGFAVSPRLATELRQEQQRLGLFAATRAVFFGPDGQTLPAGAWLRQPQLARTLRLLARRGAPAFYAGALAHAILDAVNKAAVNPGHMLAADLAHYRAVLRQPVQLQFHGDTIFGMGPPSSGGVGVLQILGLWERAPRPPPAAGAAWIHRFAQAV